MPAGRKNGCSNPTQPPPPGRVRRRRPALAALGAALAVALAAAGHPARLPAQQPPPALGESITRLGCLSFSIESHRQGRRGAGPDDWVALALANRCPFSIRHLEVALVLIDPGGGVFGASLWVLGRGVHLPAGGTMRERYAIPNPDRRVALGWQVRVVQAERLGRAGWRPFGPAQEPETPP